MRSSQRFPRMAALLAACLLLSLLPGCGDHWRPHTRQEVLAYVAEQFPGEQVTVARDFTDPLLDNGEISSERIWDCWFADLPDVVFHVGSRRFTGHPAPVMNYSLYHDRDRVFWDHYIEQYRAGVDPLSLWDTAADGDLDFRFSFMEDVPQAAEQLRAFYSWFEAQPHAGRPRYASIALDGLPLPAGYPIVRRTSLNLPSASIANPRASFHDPAGMEELCAGMLKTYYTFYHLPCPDFSQEELEAFAHASWDWAWSGLQFSCLSYGGLFEVLVRLGLEPEGGPEAFTVTGADGAFYEFSYRFTDTDGDRILWHHKRDGKPVQHAAADGIPALRIASDEFQAITGLTFHKPGT